MAKGINTVTDADIEAALERAKESIDEPLAVSVEHSEEWDMLVVTLSNNRRLLLAIEDLQGLQGATSEQLKNYELLGRGTGICFPDLDADFYVPALIDGVYGNRRWMAELDRRD